MPNPPCATCKWWVQPPPRSPWGQCHIHAPVLAGDEVWGWPGTGPADWCGEHEATTPEAMLEVLPGMSMVELQRLRDNREEVPDAL